MTFRAAAIASCAVIATGWLAVGVIAQSAAPAASIPTLSGVYNGRRCVPANSDVCPEMNVMGGQRLLTARAKALVAAFDEVTAPKYDCSPATLPIIFGDPYQIKIEQLPDRVNLSYEKDDVRRTVWLDGHGHQRPKFGQLFVHGYSTGRYEGNTFVVETSRFTYDPEGFAGDALNAPSSTQKWLTERYTLNGDVLRMELTAEDPVFLLQPFTYSMEWRKTDEPFSTGWDCDPEAAQRNLHVVKSKYPQDPPVKRRNQ
jgi:hypothetical protein